MPPGLIHKGSDWETITIGGPKQGLSRQIGCSVEENIQPGRKTVTSFRDLLFNLGKEQHDQ
jgi:hypothetical protein